MNKFALTIIAIVLVSQQSFGQEPRCSPYDYSGLSDTISSRYPAPNEYILEEVDSTSFAYYLQNLVLQPEHAKVKISDGTVYKKTNYCGVVMWPNYGDHNRQCADTVLALYVLWKAHRNETDSIDFGVTGIASYKAWESTADTPTNYVSYLRSLYTEHSLTPTSYKAWAKQQPGSKKYVEYIKHLYQILAAKNKISVEAYDNWALKVKNVENYLQYLYTKISSRNIAQLLHEKTKNESINIGDVLVDENPNGYGHVMIVLNKAVPSLNDSKKPLKPLYILGDGNLFIDGSSNIVHKGTELRILKYGQSPWTTTIPEGFKLYAFKD